MNVVMLDYGYGYATIEFLNTPIIDRYQVSSISSIEPSCSPMAMPMLVTDILKDISNYLIDFIDFC